MELDEDPEDVQISFQILLYAGNARTEAYRALECARQNDFVGAAEHLKKSEAELTQGHQVQTRLLSRVAGGEQVPLSLILIHAQDTLMTCMSECSLIEQMIELYRRIGEPAGVETGDGGTAGG